MPPGAGAWSNPINWQDGSGTKITSAHGTVAGRTDIVHIDASSFGDCILDIDLVSTGISQLIDTGAVNLILQKGLLVTNGGRLAGDGSIYNGVSGTDNGLSLTGGTFTWHSGNMGI